MWAVKACVCAWVERTIIDGVIDGIEAESQKRSKVQKKNGKYIQSARKKTAEHVHMN